LVSTESSDDGGCGASTNSRAVAACAAGAPPRENAASKAAAELRHIDLERMGILRVGPPP